MRVEKSSIGLAKTGIGRMRSALNCGRAPASQSLVFACQFFWLPDRRKMSMKISEQEQEEKPLEDNGFGNKEKEPASPLISPVA
jgi:hypothetical protein